MELTPKQEKFAQAYVSCSNATESYRQSYNVGKMKIETVHRKAIEVLQNGNVAARIAELRAELAKKELWSREQSVKALIDVIAEPDKKTDIISAVKELNAMHGYNTPKKHEVTGKDGAPLNGVMLVPMSASLEEWEAVTMAQQAALKRDVRK